MLHYCFIQIFFILDVVQLQTCMQVPAVIIDIFEFPCMLLPNIGVNMHGSFNTLTLMSGISFLKRLDLKFSLADTVFTCAPLVSVTGIPLILLYV